MRELVPEEILEEVSRAVPRACREHMIIIGSLAVGYHFRGRRNRPVRTKDVDCLLFPRKKVAVTAKALASRLLVEGWTHHTEWGWGKPQDHPKPLSNLSGVRLVPPDKGTLQKEPWFLELLAPPETKQEAKRKWVPIKLRDGYYGLATFEFLPLLANEPRESDYGILYARPEMMALANLLSHPRIGEATMSTLWNGREIKRSNKDLGRVLALAWLSGDEEISGWPRLWEKALKTCFPHRWRLLAKRVGKGFRELLSSENDLEEAFLTCDLGVLAHQHVAIDQLRAVGRRLLQDAIVPLETSAGRA